MHTGLESPKGVWWKPVHRSEKIWIGLAFAWCMVLFAMMPLWHLRGGQNPAGERYRVDPQDFLARTQEFIDTYQVGEENGYPIVEPPAGSDIYLVGRMWSWMPILRLRQGVEYTLHLSSLDVNHGFSLQPGSVGGGQSNPLNVNIQIVPGYDYGLRVTPNEAGDFRVICNEFCGIGHHVMVGKVIVTDEAGAVVGSTDASTVLSPAEQAGGAQ